MVLKTLKEFCDSVIEDVSGYGNETTVYVNPNTDGVCLGFNDNGASYVVVGSTKKTDDGGIEDDLS